MSPAPGSRIGTYTITDKLGEGGMGEVYRATDSRLKREVAIKVLPEAFTEDPDRLARFEREAQVLAQLHHPNIASIFGLEESGGVRALVMELVEGPTLAERMAAGQLPVEETLGIVAQIAEALEEAHAKGIVHRDLKPANVKLAPDGRVKVLDFGLAKALSPSEAVSGSEGGSTPMNSPTLTAAMGTQLGVILGTASYMAPEQARGVPIDKRADVWAFGVVLYEMLTGVRLFDGEMVSDVLAGVLKSEIDFDKLPADTPSSLRRLLRRCLERKPKNRLHDIADARIVIQEVVAGDVDADTAVAETAAPRTGLASKLPWLVAGLAVVAAIAAMMIGPGSRNATGGAAYELSLSGPSDGRFLIGSNLGWGVVSPDGRRIVVSATTSEGSGLWVRSLDRDDGRLLAGTETGFYPFWSPDSRWVAFFDRGELRRIEVDGGLPEKICGAGWGRGGSWSETGRIVFNPMGGGPISVVEANEGDPRQVTELDVTLGEDAHYWPVWLPDGEHFLYFIRSGRREHQGIYLGRVREDGIDPERRRIVASSSSGVFVPARDGEPAMLLWVQEETLLARAFDPESFTLSGPTSQVAEGVRVLASQRASMASASSEGTLTFASSTFGRNRVAWFDRQGRGPEPIAGPDWSHFQPKISPDGRWFTLVLVSGGNADVWLFDTENGDSRALTTSAQYEESACWSPDSREIVFRGGGKGMEFYRTPIDGSRAPQRILADRPEKIFDVSAWVSDNWIIGDISEEDASLDLYGFHLDPTIEPVALATGPGNQFAAVTAPDGRAMVYMSEESGSLEAYLVSLSLADDRLATGTDRHRVPVDRAAAVAWSVDGGELYAMTADGELFAVPLRREGGRLRMGTATKLFSTAIANPYFSAGPDRDRFLILVDPDAEHQTLGVLLDWRARLESSSGD